MSKLKRFFRITALAVLMLSLLFFVACPVRYEDRAVDITTPLLASIAEAWNTLAVTRLSTTGSDVYTVYYWVPPNTREALVSLLPAAMDAADNRDFSAEERYTISGELGRTVVEFNDARQRGTRAVTRAALDELIEEARKLNDVNFARRINNGFHLFYFQAWITPADHVATGMDAQIAAALALPAGATTAQIETQMLALLEAMERMRVNLRRGGTFPPDDTNISSEFSAVRTASNDGNDAEGETEATRAFNALTPALRSWQSPSSAPILEVEFAFPVSIGSVRFTPFSAVDYGASPITTYQIDFWNPLTGGWDKVQGSYPSHDGGVLGHSGEGSISIRHYVQFDAELVSTRFRFNVTQATGPVGLWEFRLNRGTEGRFSLVDAVANARDNLTETRFSRVGGVNIPPGEDWVHPDAGDVYQAVINAANAIAMDLRSTRFAIREVHAALDSATAVFNATKRDGIASPEYLALLDDLEVAIRGALVYFDRFQMVGDMTTGPDDVWDIHFAVSWDAQQDFNRFITEMRDVRFYLFESVAAIRGGISEVENELESLQAGAVPGRRSTGTWTPGTTNIAPFFVFSTQHHLVNYSMGGQFNDGGFGEALRNTSFNQRWGRLRGGSGTTPGAAFSHDDCHCTPEQRQLPDCPGTGWSTWRYGDMYDQRPPETPIEDMAPIWGTVNFGVPVSIEEIRIVFACSSAGAAPSVNPRARVGNYSIEFLCLETLTWQVAWSRTNATQPVWGARGYPNEQFVPSPSDAAFTQPRTPHRFDVAVAPFSGPNYPPTEAYADISVIGRPYITSSQFRLTFRHTPFPIDAWNWGPQFWQFEFITARNRDDTLDL